MKIEGEENLEDCRAMVERQGETVQSKHRRFFCKRCGEVPCGRRNRTLDSTSNRGVAFCPPFEPARERTASGR
jgi:hypothetical protein